MTPVVALLRRRAAAGSRVPHGDGARIALAVEGGAMRGVISAGMVAALEVLGLTHAFDAVYGSSAGAINAAYFLAGQAGLGSTIYYEDINNRRFINFGRAARGRAILDLGFLLDDVAVHRKRLQVGRVVSASSPLVVLATDVDAEAPVALRGFADGPALLGALRASSTMPIVAGGPWPYGGRRLLDASLSEPIPVGQAETDGHTHILALLTRPGMMSSRPSTFDRLFVAPRLRRLSPALADRYLDRAVPYAQVTRAIDAGTGPAGRASVLGLRPEGAGIGRLERRSDVLRAGAALGYETVMRTFGLPETDARPG